MKHWLLYVFLCIGCIFPFSGQAQVTQDSLLDQAKQWTKQLSSQDPRFVPLGDATSEQVKLGANSHQSLVTFYQKNRAVGYMVIEDGVQGYQLLEYGLGEFPIFDQNVLSSVSSIQGNLERMYSGLESVWVAKDGIYDAKSGEQYPEQAAGHEHERVISNVGKSSTLQNVFNRNSNDSFGWIKPEGQINSQQEFMTEIQHHNISFLADLFDGTVKAPYAVNGFHVWDTDTFIELSDYGSRFVPYSYALSIGKLVK